MKIKMKIKTTLLAVSLTSILLVGCGETSSNDDAALKVENIKELVSDYSGATNKSESASITSQQLIVNKADGDKLVYDLSEEDFFVSIAPYVDQTHPWTNHSLTGCQGELADKEFDVYIEDTEGNVILDEKLKAKSNGFFDLWLPRDKTYQVKIKYDGKVSESEISTFENDGTCITTMQLT